MHPENYIPPARDRALFTPGPLTTSWTVKAAMLRDLGSRDVEFRDTVKRIRERLVKAAQVPADEDWEAVLLQGSGTYGIEAVLGSILPPQGRVLVLVNGSYGERAVQMLERLKVDHLVQREDENVIASAEKVDAALRSDKSISHVFLVHCETSTGIVNPLQEIGALVRKHGRVFIVDAMSSFGAVPIDFAASGIDYLVSSANKCLEGVPGFTFVLCRRSQLLATEGWARTLSLDLVAQLKGFEKDGQFRFTPPTHALLAFSQALDEFDREGGVAGRAARYRRNYEVLIQGMEGMGFKAYVRPEWRGYILTTFLCPNDEKFQFGEFYRRLNRLGFVIYPGKLSKADTFRMGSIGRLFESDMRGLLGAVRGVMEEMGFNPRA